MEHLAEQLDDEDVLLPVAQAAGRQMDEAPAVVLPARNESALADFLHMLHPRTGRAA